MTNERGTFIAKDLDGFKWIICSPNQAYARLRLRDFGIYTNDIHALTEEETALYKDEIEVATKHKSFAVYVSG